MKDLQKIKEFFSKPLEEAKTKINDIKKQLDALGVKYEMSKTDKVRPFKVIYKPVNKSDEFYDKFNNIVDLANLKGVVKTSMNESNGFTSGKQMLNIKLKRYPKAIAKVNQLIDMIGEDRFTMEMAEWIWDFFSNAHFERPVNEATKEEETRFHKKLDTLVHNTFGKRKGEMEEIVNYSPEGKDKIYSLISQALQQGKLTKDAQAVFMKWMADPNSTEEAIIKALESITFRREQGLEETLLERVFNRIKNDQSRTKR